MPNKSSVPEFVLPTAERTLTVFCSYRPTILIYWRRKEQWECVFASHRIQFLSVVPIADIESTVEKLGWRWKWYDASDEKVMQRSADYKLKHGGTF